MLGNLETAASRSLKRTTTCYIALFLSLTIPCRFWNYGVQNYSRKATMQYCKHQKYILSQSFKSGKVGIKIFRRSWRCESFSEGTNAFLLCLLISVEWFSLLNSVWGHFSSYALSVFIFWCSIGLLINLRSRQRTISQTLHSSFKILFWLNEITFSCF